MKLIISILILSLISCKKEIQQPTQRKYELTAVVNLKPIENRTLYYDVFVSNDKRNWLWVKRIEKTDLNNGFYTFSFDAPTVCIVSILNNLPVYGASRETVFGNERMQLEFNTIIIHN